MAEIKQTVTLAQGADRTWLSTISDEDGPIEEYTRGNPLTAELSRGDNQPVLATPAVVWTTPPGFRLTVTRANTAALEAGIYQLRGFVGEPGGVRKLFLDVRLRIFAGPGTEEEGRSYCTADQIATYFSGLDDLIGDGDETGFAEQRADASSWIDDILLAHWNGDPSWLRDKLDAGGLVVTPKVVRIAALKAISIVLGDQLADAQAVAAGRQSARQQAGIGFARQASSLVRMLVAEIDTNADGRADILVDCSTIRTRYG